MKKISDELSLPFPYLIDETQEMPRLMVRFALLIFLDITQTLNFNTEVD